MIPPVTEGDISVSSADLSDLAEFHEFFSRKWDPALLVHLAAAGPTRFNRLAAAVSTRVGERLADVDLNRALKRLREQGLVLRSDDDLTYGLTEEGRERARRINSIRYGGRPEPSQESSAWEEQ